MVGSKIKDINRLAIRQSEIHLSDYPHYISTD